MRDRDSGIISIMTANDSVRFFDEQFRRQAAAAQFELNPFEARALPYISGDVLELGCGLGNLAVAAAHHGAQVTALDGSRAAIESLSARAKDQRLEIATRLADLAVYEPEREYDCVVAIGLFMFFRCAVARRELERALAAVRGGGIAVVNVLIVGTTFMGMFDEERGYCLFGENELPDLLEGWQMLDDRIETFDAPGGTIKRFRTCIARRPISEPR
ncbi:MAG TPA: class I SAM-dependent methyltransferase [Burkholderiales bacterium]|nr:class I SAM-dependent methyltransferase [Burkholderiales bacterium]